MFTGINKIVLVLFAVGIYLFTKLLSAVILRGFSPFISARPWVIRQLMYELSDEDLKRPNFKAYSFGCGRSGFLHFLGKKYTGAELVGVEKHLFPFVIAEIQRFFRQSRMEIIRSRHYHRVDVSDAGLIYCHLYSLEALKELGEKFKFECKPGTIIISNGFVLPALNPYKIIELGSGKGRLAFLSENRYFMKKHRVNKKENKIYFFKV